MLLWAAGVLFATPGLSLVFLVFSQKDLHFFFFFLLLVLVLSSKEKECAALGGI